jgi:tRNA dimethylallyltransferase
VSPLPSRTEGRAALPRRVLVVCGPTAAGKTDLAVELAERFEGEIVGADSRQVYREMDVATAKPSAELRERVPHHLIDIVDPDQAFDVADWRNRALDALADIASRDRTAIICGGTGLYLRSLLVGLFEGPAADLALRERLAAEEADQPGTLHARLTRVDPKSAARIHPNDLVRVVRALEVFETSGDTLAAWHARHGLAERPFDALILEVTVPRDELNRRIDARATAMVASGLLDEVRALGRRYDLDLKAFSAIGYREARACLRGELAEDDLFATIARATRAYAKRQRIWLRGQMSTVEVSTADTLRAMGMAGEFLG